MLRQNLNNELFLCLALFFVLLSSCHKRDVSQQAADQVEETIYFDGSINNSPVLLKSGTDGYFRTSSYKQLPDCVYTFSGEIKKHDCNTCGNSLRIDFTDVRTSLPAEPVNVEQTFSTGYRGLLGMLPVTSSLDFEVVTNRLINSVEWKFDGQTVRNDITVSEAFPKPGQQNYSANVQCDRGAKMYLTGKVYVDSATGIFACKIVTLTAGSSVIYSASIVGGRAPFNYIWPFAVSNTTYVGGGNIRLQIIDADQHVCEAIQSEYFPPPQDPFPYTPAYRAGVSFHNLKFNKAYRGVRLTWTDESNGVYRSAIINQTTDNFFKIVDSKPFPPDENGQKRRLLSLEFDVLLADSVRTKRIKSNNTSIVVAYP